MHFDTRLELRLSREQKDQLEAAAGRAGMNSSQYLRCLIRTPDGFVEKNHAGNETNR